MFMEIWVPFHRHLITSLVNKPCCSNEVAVKGYPDFHKKDRKSTRLNSSHLGTSYAVFCFKKKTSWELDVWGHVRSRKAATKAESAALAADYELARQSHAAPVAPAYFTTNDARPQEPKPE